MELAPIALTVFNRPDHTRRTLEALANNDLASDSNLFIFADAARNESEVDAVNKTREVIRGFAGFFSSVNITERDQNWGLAKSIITAVTELTQKYGKVIVLEDDIVTSKGFLQYMNDALEVYQDEPKVMHISGYMFPVKQNLPDTVFYNTASTWGWATWDRAWQHFNNDIHELKRKIDSSGRLKEFNIDNTYNFYAQILDNYTGKRITWGIRWYSTMFLRGGYALHPGKSLVQNIGNDQTGVNAGNQPQYTQTELADYVYVQKIPIKKSEQAWEAMKQYYSNASRTERLTRYKNQAKRFLKLLIPKKLFNIIKDPSIIQEKLSDRKLRRTPRFKPTMARIFKRDIKVVDSSSYLFQKREIFGKEIYKFRASSERPFIIDGGANIGLASIYFKQLYPKAKVIAFEPDPKIAEICRANLSRFGFRDVQVVEQGLWKEETELSFFAEGADGGRISDSESAKQIIRTTLLSKFIDQDVDFLKLDIEGSELEVIREIQDKLGMVKNIFIEYHSYYGRPQELHQLLEILSNAGFRYYIYGIGQTQNSPYSDIKVLHGMDGQVNIAAIRI